MAETGHTLSLPFIDVFIVNKYFIPDVAIWKGFFFFAKR